MYIPLVDVNEDTMILSQHSKQDKAFPNESEQGKGPFVNYASTLRYLDGQANANPC